MTSPEKPNENIPQVLPYEEINQQFAGRWVLVDIIKKDPLGHPLEGIVLNSGTKDEVFNVLKKSLNNSDQKPPRSYYFFSAGSTIPLDQMSEEQIIGMNKQFDAINRDIQRKG